jgi:hypothetical protein
VTFTPGSSTPLFTARSDAGSVLDEAEAHTSLTLSTASHELASAGSPLSPNASPGTPKPVSTYTPAPASAAAMGTVRLAPPSPPSRCDVGWVSDAAVPSHEGGAPGLLGSVLWYRPGLSASAGFGYKAIKACIQGH